MVDGTLDNSASAYIEAPVTLLGFSFSVNPASGESCHHSVLTVWSADHVHYLIVVITDPRHILAGLFFCAVYLTQLSTCMKSNRQTAQSGQSEVKQASGCSQSGDELTFWSTPLTMAQREKANREAKSDDINQFAAATAREQGN